MALWLYHTRFHATCEVRENAEREERGKFHLNRVCERKNEIRRFLVTLQHTQHDIVSFLFTCTVNLWWHECLMLSLTLKCLSPINFIILLCSICSRTNTQIETYHHSVLCENFPFPLLVFCVFPCSIVFICVRQYQLKLSTWAKCVNLIFSPTFPLVVLVGSIPEFKSEIKSCTQLSHFSLFTLSCCRRAHFFTLETMNLAAWMCILLF